MGLRNWRDFCKQYDAQARIVLGITAVALAASLYATLPGWDAARKKELDLLDARDNLPEDVDNQTWWDADQAAQAATLERMELEK